MSVVKLLIDKGADVNAKANHDATPLHEAAKEGHMELAELLITRGADVNAKETFGETPLHEAVKGAHKEVAKLLAANGADVYAKSLSGRSPIVLAKQLGHAELVSFLEGHSWLSKRENLQRLAKELTDLHRLYVRALHMGYSDDEYQKRELAIKLAPWWANAYFNLALVLEKLRNYKMAIDNLNLYLLAVPDAPDAAAVKEKIYEIEFLEKQRTRAEEHMDRGIELNDKARDYPGAAAEYKEAIRLDPGNGRAHAYLGGTYVNLKRNKEAIVELEEGLRLGYKGRYAYNNLAVSYNRLGDSSKAISILEDGLREGWGAQGLIHQNLGTYYKKAGSGGKAMEHFKKAYELSVHDKDVNQQYVREMMKALTFGW